MHTRRFLRSLTVVVAAASLSLAAHATSAAAAEHDHGGSSRSPQREPVAARERSHDDAVARHRAASHRVNGPRDQDVADGNSHGAGVLTAAITSTAHPVRAIAPPVAPALARASAQPIAAVTIPHPYPPLLVVPTVPVAPPASGAVVVGATRPPLNLATIVTLVVAGAMALLAGYLARRPA